VHSFTISCSRLIALAGFLILLALGFSFPRSAFGQDDHAAFSIGVFFDEEATQHWEFIPAMSSPINAYFLMLNLGEQIAGYENSVEISGADSEDWIIDRSPIVGLDVDTDVDGYVVGIGVCSGMLGGNYTIREYAFSYLAGPVSPQDTYVCAAPPTTQNPSIPGQATYQACGAMLVEISPIALIYEMPIAHDEGCAAINPSFVPTATRSWGSLKSKY